MGIVLNLVSADRLGDLVSVDKFKMLPDDLPAVVQAKVDRLTDQATTPEQKSVINALQDATIQELGTTEERREAFKEVMEFDVLTHPSVAS